MLPSGKNLTRMLLERLNEVWEFTSIIPMFAEVFDEGHVIEKS